MQTRLSVKNNDQTRLAKAQIRNNNGWSLAATMVMMIVISIFVGAMWSALLPAYMHVANLRYKDTARSVNEGAVDSMVAQINSAALVLPASRGLSTSSTTTANQGNTTYTINSTILNCGSAPGNGGPPQNCVFYTTNRLPTSNFFLVTTNVTKAGLQRNLAVLLDPIPPPAPTSGISTSGMYGINTVNQVGLASINGYNLPANWTSPYQFADTTVVKGITWQIGNGQLDRSQVIGGSQFEFWHNGDSPPLQPPTTIALTYEPFTQIMGNVYSNYPDQSGANGNGYQMRNQLSDVAGGPNVPGPPVYGASSTANANVFGAYNGQTLNNSGVPSGFQSGNNNYSIPIPPPVNPSTPPAGSGSTVNPNWGFNAQAGTTAGNMPTVGTLNGGTAYTSTPYTGGYITSPGPGQAGALDTWAFPAPPVQPAPGAPIGAAAPATGGLGVPNTTGTYFAGAPAAVTVKGELHITNSATSIPGSLSTQPGEVINIPPGNYMLSSLNVLNGGKVTVDSGVQGQTQFFMSPNGTGQGTTGAVYVDNNSSINMTGIGGTGFKNTGTTGFGSPLPSNQPAVDTANKIQETSGSCLNLVINTNSACNMLFAGNTRAIVNAPNANVNVGYQPTSNYQYTANSLNDPAVVMSKDANFYGSIIAGNCSLVSDYANGAGAYLHYDTKLKTMTYPYYPGQGMAGGAGGLVGAGQPVTFNKPLGFYDPWQYAQGANGALATTSWRAASWQEQLGAW